MKYVVFTAKVFVPSNVLRKIEKNQFHFASLRSCWFLWDFCNFSIGKQISSQYGKNHETVETIVQTKEPWNMNDYNID